MFFPLLMLLIGWICFTFAILNIIAAAYAYCLRKPGSWGLGAFLRTLLFSAAFAAWYYIVFFIFPALK